MRKFRRKWQRLSMYKKSLILFSLLLVSFSFLILTYVYNSMVIYERNLVDNYIKYVAEKGVLSSEVKSNAFKISPYEKDNASIKDGLTKLFNTDLKIKKNGQESTDNIFAYNLYNEDTLIGTVKLKSKDTYKRMAILTINEWNVEDATFNLDNGIYNYEITVPANYTITVNGKTLGSDILTKSGDVPNLERLTEYVEIEKSNTYTLNNLVYKPKIVIQDEKNEEVEYKIDDNKIVIGKSFKTYKTLEEAKQFIKDDFDILTLAENYSLFLTDDLKGSYHGFDKLMPYLIKDSYMYNMAYTWAHGVDITFVSSHYLKNPIFTNEEVKNIIVYNDVAFSAEVYLEKNMMVSGKLRQDIMHDRLYFVYYDGGYKLVNMEAVK